MNNLQFTYTKLSSISAQYNIKNYNTQLMTWIKPWPPLNWTVTLLLLNISGRPQQQTDVITKGTTVTQFLIDAWKTLITEWVFVGILKIVQ